MHFPPERKEKQITKICDIERLIPCSSSKKEKEKEKPSPFSPFFPFHELILEQRNWKFEIVNGVNPWFLKLHWIKNQIKYEFIYLINLTVYLLNNN